MVYGRRGTKEQKASCGGPPLHVEPCQHAPVEMELSIENRFDKHHTFDYEGEEKRKEKDRVRSLIEAEMNTRRTDIGDIQVGTRDTRVEITVDVECRCHESKKDIIKQAKKKVPDQFHVVEDSTLVADRLSI